MSLLGIHGVGTFASVPSWALVISLPILMGMPSMLQSHLRVLILSEDPDVHWYSPWVQSDHLHKPGLHHVVVQSLQTMKEWAGRAPYSCCLPTHYESHGIVHCSSGFRGELCLLATYGYPAQTAVWKSEPRPSFLTFYRQGDNVNIFNRAASDTKKRPLRMGVQYWLHMPSGDTLPGYLWLHNQTAGSQSVWNIIYALCQAIIHSYRCLEPLSL